MKDNLGFKNQNLTKSGQKAKNYNSLNHFIKNPQKYLNFSEFRSKFGAG
jgi:hypothetical protein